ncbi:hypothetical protein COCC4DRAFT_89997, partial [Bipolaris maydis ATCC 48331]
AEPSIECVDPSKQSQCTCTCTNGIVFSQTLSLDASTIPSDGTCQADRDRCLKRQQQLNTEIEEEREQCAAQLNEATQTHIQREKELLEKQHELRTQLKLHQPPTWTYHGCYIDNLSRAIGGNGFSLDTHLTVDNCKRLCRGSKYAAMQYGTHCLCGNKFRFPVTKVSDSECNVNCAGN